MNVSFPFTRGRLIPAPVRVRHGSRSCRPMMALDTGARRTVVTPWVAAELGFNPQKLESATRIVGATGPGSASLLSVESVSVLGLEVADLQIVCYPLPAALGVQGVLGLDFLNRFRVVIDGPAETVTISQRTEQESSPTARDEQ